MGSLLFVLKMRLHAGSSGQAHICRHVYTYAHAFSKGCNHQVYEAGKNSAKKQPTGKKRISLGLKRGHRLYASLPWRNEFHIPFPIFPSSVWACFYPPVLFRQTLSLQSCESTVNSSALSERVSVVHFLKAITDEALYDFLFLQTYSSKDELSKPWANTTVAFTHFCANV